MELSILGHSSIFTESFDAEVRALNEKGFTVEEEETKSLFAGCTLRSAWIPSKDTRGVWIALVDSTSVPKFGGRPCE
jgi:hypothetical protein